MTWCHTRSVQVRGVPSVSYKTYTERGNPLDRLRHRYLKSVSKLFEMRWILKRELTDVVGATKPKIGVV